MDNGTEILIKATADIVRSAVAGVPTVLFDGREKSIAKAIETIYNQLKACAKTN